MNPSGMSRGCLTPVNILDPATTTSYRQSIRDEKNFRISQFLIPTDYGAAEDIHEEESSLHYLIVIIQDSF